MGYTTGTRGVKAKAIFDWGANAVMRATTVDAAAAMCAMEPSRTVVMRDANVLLHQTVPASKQRCDIFDYTNGLRAGILERLRFADVVYVSVDDPRWVPECKRETQAERDLDDDEKLGKLRTKRGEPLSASRLEAIKRTFDQSLLDEVSSVTPLVLARPTRYRVVDEILRRLIDQLRADAARGLFPAHKAVVVDGVDPAGVARTGERAPRVAGTDDVLAQLLARRGLAPCAIADVGDIHAGLRRDAVQSKPFPSYEAPVPIGEGDAKAPRLEEAVRCLGTCRPQDLDAANDAADDAADNAPSALAKRWIARLAQVAQVTRPAR